MIKCSSHQGVQCECSLNAVPQLSGTINSYCNNNYSIENKEECFAKANCFFQIRLETLKSLHMPAQLTSFCKSLNIVLWALSCSLKSPVQCISVLLILSLFRDQSKILCSRDLTV